QQRGLPPAVGLPAGACGGARDHAAGRSGRPARARAHAQHWPVGTAPDGFARRRDRAGRGRRRRFRPVPAALTARRRPRAMEAQALDDIATFLRRLQWIAAALALLWLAWLLAPVLTPFVLAALLGWL